jgi:hypothetical protein
MSVAQVLLQLFNCGVILNGVAGQFVVLGSPKSFYRIHVLFSEAGFCSQLKQQLSY